MMKYSFFVDNKSYIELRGMKKSHDYSTKSLKVNKTISGYPVIPSCQSPDKFFSLKEPLRRKRQSKHVWNSSLNLLNSLHTLTTSVRLNPEEKPDLKSQTPTMEASIIQQGMEFKKQKPKRKPNNKPGKKNGSSNEAKHVEVFSATPLKIHNLPPARLPKEAPQNKKPARKISLDDFEFIKKIGEGAYSEVYLVMEKHTSFICTLKVLDKSHMQKNDLCHVFTRQAKIHHYLDHQNIVKLFGLFDDDQYIYLICEYAAHGDLYRHIKHKRRSYEEFSLKEVARIVKQLCEAVLAMHEDFLMHRDIKPQNIFLSLGNEVKLGDFGWSVYNINKALRNTQCGTPLYLAPELVGQGEYSEAVDVWAIGVLTYELLTGQTPFAINNVRDMKKVVSQEIYFDMIEDDVARDFAMKLLEKQASKRVDIEEILEHPFLELCEQKGEHDISLP